MKKLLVAIFGFLILNPSFAQIVTDRPDQTESSSTVPKGSLQLESGFLIGFEGNGIIANRQILAPTNLFRYGISEKIELRLLSQYETMKYAGVTVKGISDLEIGTKIQILKRSNTNTEIAFLSHLVVPSGTLGLSNERYGTINKLSISHMLSENMGLGYNIGYNYFGSNGDFTYSVALGIGVNDKVGIYIEPYGEIADLEENVLNFDVGFTYLANENLQFDFSFGTGISHKMNYISVGFSWLMVKNN